MECVSLTRAAITVRQMAVAAVIMYAMQKKDYILQCVRATAELLVLQVEAPVRRALPQVLLEAVVTPKMCVSLTQQVYINVHLILLVILDRLQITASAQQAVIVQADSAIYQITNVNSSLPPPARINVISQCSGVTAMQTAI